MEPEEVRATIGVSEGSEGPAVPARWRSGARSSPRPPAAWEELANALRMELAAFRDDSEHRSIARVRERYLHWWLVLVDHVGYGLSGSDREQLRQLVRLDHSWDKVILVNPLDATQGYEL